MTGPTPFEAGWRRRGEIIAALVRRRNELEDAIESYARGLRGGDDIGVVATDLVTLVHQHKTYRPELEHDEELSDLSPGPAKVVFLGGPFATAEAGLTRTPPTVLIGGHRYRRIDDPETGDFLGGYAYDGPQFVLGEKPMRLR